MQSVKILLIFHLNFIFSFKINSSIESTEAKPLHKVGGFPALSIFVKFWRSFVLQDGQDFVMEKHRSFSGMAAFRIAANLRVLRKRTT